MIPSLPEAIQFILLEEWLKKDDIYQLVIATTNKKDRVAWLSAIYQVLSPNYQIKATLVHEHLESDVKDEKCKDIVQDERLPSGCSDDDESGGYQQYQVEQIILNKFRGSDTDLLNFSDELEEDTITLNDFFADNFTYEDLHSIHLRLLDLLDLIFRLNDLEIYHTDIKASNIKLFEINNIQLINWKFVTKWNRNDIQFPNNLKHRHFQFNLPFSSIIFTEEFYQKYTNYLKNGNEITSIALKPFVMEYMNEFFQSNGLGDYQIMYQIMFDFLGFTFPDLNEINQKNIIENEVRNPYVIDYIVNILENYTRYRADGSLDLRPYFFEVFLPIIDLWGFLSIYFPFIHQLAKVYYSLNPLELKLYKQFQYLLDHYLFVNSLDGIDHDEFVSSLHVITIILEKLISYSNIPTMMKMKSMMNKNNTDPVLSIEKEDDRAMNKRDNIRVYSLCSLSLNQEMKIMNPSNSINKMMIIASGGSDGNIRLWKIQKSHHDCVDILQGHSNYVTALIQLPSGYLASASHDTTIKIWDLTNLLRDEEQQYISDRCILTINAHTGPIFRLCLLSDGRLASSSSDETVKIWNLENGKAEMICPDHEDCVLSVTEWKKNYLISGTDSNDSILRIWKLSSSYSPSTGEGGECVATIPIVNCKGINFLLSLQDHRLAVADGDKNIRIWEFLPDSSSSSSSSSLFKGQGNDDDEEGDNVEEDEEVDSFPYQINQKNIMILTGHYWEVTYLAELKKNTMMSSSYDYHGLVSSSVDHMIRIWNLRNGHCDRILQGHQSFISGILLIPPQQPLSQRSQDYREDGTHIDDVDNQSSNSSSTSTIFPYPTILSCSFDSLIHIWTPY